MTHSQYKLKCSSSSVQLEIIIAVSLVCQEMYNANEFFMVLENRVSLRKETSQSHLNDSSAPTALDVGEEGVGQADHLAHPVEHDGLQLGAGGGGGPGEADAADGVAQHVAQDGRVRVAGGEVGVEAGVLPVRDLRGLNVSLTSLASRNLKTLSSRKYRAGLKV